MSDVRGFVDTKDNQKDFGSKYFDLDAGPYVAEVKYNVDPLRMGRLGVNIPAITNTNNPSADQIIWCQYLAPFYGAKSLNAVDRQDPYSFKGSQTSYGMWAIPPDVDTSVLVIFAKGEKQLPNAFWIGCIQDPVTNHMVPGNASSTNSALGVEEVGEFDTEGKQGVYQTDILPVGEKNRNILQKGETLDTLNQWKLPVNSLLADQLQEQGLIKDEVRGHTSSSAQRESPSNVYGMNTPGRIRPDSRTLNIGLEGSPVRPDRGIGHSFVMDDGDINGENQQIRLRTSSGHQILMNDTEGVLYIANGSGNSWIEMSPEGKIYLYSKDGLNVRTDGNFDLHSGADINFHAKNNIKLNAEGNVALAADFYLQFMGNQGIEQSSQKGGIRSFAKGAISSFATGQQLHGAGDQVHLAGTQVHFNSTSASPEWGAAYLQPEHPFVGIVKDETQNDVNITIKGGNVVLEENSAKTLTTVPNLVTHEPFTRAPSAVIEGVSQWQNEKEWKRLSSIPGTLEYMAQKNRESPDKSIQQIQLLADAKKYILDKGGTSANLDKAKALSDEFYKTYNDVYAVKAVVDNLSKDNIKNIILSKVTGGRLVSSSNIKPLLRSRVISAAKTFGGGLLNNFTAGNSIPPSLRGTLKGTALQIGSSIKAGLSRAFSSIFSDVRLKHDIRFVGRSPSGLRIYRFKYNNSNEVYEGVMAQEVPWASEMTDTGYYMVDYSKLDVEFRRIS